MAKSFLERVGAALDILNDGLKPFVQREMQAHYKETCKSPCLHSGQMR